APATMNGLAGIKKSDPIARKRDSKKTPSGPRLPIHVQRFCTVGTTGKKNEVTASPITSTTAMVSFLANEVTTDRLACGCLIESDRKPARKGLFDDMIIHQAGKFEHIDFLLAVEDGFKSRVGFDEFLFLKVVLFNIFPKLLSQFCPGNWIFAHNFGKRGIRL